MTTNNLSTGDVSTHRVLDEQAERLARRSWPAVPIRPGITVSLEFFPAPTPDGASKLDACVDRLARLGPEFVSVTYGAGGTTQDRTIGTIRRISGRGDVPVAGHLTCVGASRAEIAGVVDTYLDAGVRHIVALRGDAPADGAPEPADAYRSAADLVAGLRSHAEAGSVHDLRISVAAYPEVHPMAASPRADLDNLKRKLDAGADQAITQFFYDTDAFLRFLDRCRSAGITAPIVPGIMPIVSYENVCRFSARCGTTIPPWMHELFGGLDDSPEVRRLLAATVAAEQCRRLAEHGVNHFHFYTMNKPELTEATCRILGVRASGQEVAAAGMPFDDPLAGGVAPSRAS